ncbi:shikimate kinase [Maribacter aestuarii]|uniref:shikimate kinase n=1 Tax=Maribacter aestuarii TaxID=1130723 RepID=UPI0025A52489|nr:shikimate kinase [Maribacter aestuarii]
MKIVLVGYMGSGKTTIGKILAKDLNIKFLDLDDYIEESESISIKTIFKERGEIYFRKLEFQYLKEILALEHDFVLSSGGGTPCYGNNMKIILAATPNVCYIKVSIAELVARLANQKETRPLIKNIDVEELPEFIGKHLFERSFYYSQAFHTINADQKNPMELSEEIKQILV